MKPTTPPPDWPPLTPLASSSLPLFPVDALPGAIARFARALAAQTETPVDLVSMLSLAAMSASTAGRVEVQISHGHSECLSLYIVVAMRSGTRKSAVFKDVFEPLKHYESDVRSRNIDAVEKGREQHLRLVAAIEKSRKDRAKNRQGTGPTEDEEHDALLREFRASHEPVEFLLFAEDVTPETLTTLVAEQRGALAVFSSEGGGVFDLMAGRYSKSGSPNFDLFLKGWSGEGVRVHRRDRFEDIPRVTLTLGLATQPGTLEVLGRNAAFTDRGLSARLLFSLPDDRLGRRTHGTVPVPTDVSATYRDCLRGILQGCENRSDDGAVSVGRLLMSERAYQRWNAFQLSHEPRLAHAGDLGHMSGWGGKLAGTLARIAALFHVFECGAVRAALATELPMETMERALSLASYLTDHARAAFGQMQADPAHAAAQRLWGWIEDRRQARFEGSDAARGLRGSFRTVAELRPAIEALERLGYLRAVPAPPRAAGRPGRPSSPAYEVRPGLLGNNPDNPKIPCVESTPADSLDCSDCSQGTPTMPLVGQLSPPSAEPPSAVDARCPMDAESAVGGRHD